MATKPNIHSPVVAVHDGVLLITELVETDPETVRAAEAAVDPEAAVRAWLRIGSRATELTSVELGADMIERRFQAMTGAFDTSLVKAVTAMAETADGLVDKEHGTLPAVLGELRQDLEQLFGDTFDADSKSSVIAKVEQVVLDAGDRMARGVRATFNLDEADSPLARTKREVTDVVKEEVRAVLSEVRGIAEHLTTTAAVAAVSGKLTSKGVAFEEILAAGMEPIASVHGDIVEQVGTVAGAGGTRKGDLAVTVNPDDAAGRVVRFVIEAKDRDLSMTKTLAALDAAVANHEAVAAMAVFASGSQAPVTGPFWFAGNRAIVVYDKADPDPRALRLAYEWARWVARRSVQEQAETTVDFVAAHGAIDRARRALKRHQTIKACHSAIANKVNEAKGHVADLVGEVDLALDELVAALEMGIRVNQSVA